MGHFAGLYAQWNRIGQLLRWRRAAPSTLDALIAMAATSLDATIVADERGCILDMNAMAETLFGRNRSDVVGRTISQSIVPKRFRAAHETGLALARSATSVASVGRPMKIDGLHADGREIPLTVALSKVPTERGLAFVAFFRPRNSQALGEAGEKAAPAKLAQDTQVRDRFLAVMSHELRTPLTGILGALDLLKGSQLTIGQRELADTASRSGRALLAIISDMIELAQSSENGWKCLKSEFSLLGAIADVLAIVAPQADQRKNAIRVHYDPALPHQFLGDEAKIRQVILHLMSNAVKFTQNGEIDLAVEAAGEQASGHELEISVTDNGQGVPEEDHHRLFREFSQIDLGYSRHADGSGLGLVLSKRLVQAMGGKIGFDATPAKGSRFWFRVKLEATDAQPDVMPVAHSAHAKNAALPLSLLVVDDNETIRSIVQSLVQQLGHRVMVADGGIAAIDMIRERRFDGVFMDISMPGIDGVEAIKMIRAMEEPARNTPIVVLTGHALGTDRDRFLAAGADYYLSKPINLPALSNMLDALQGRAEQRQAASAVSQAQSTTPIIDESVFAALREAVPPADLLRIYSNFAQDLKRRRQSLTANSAQDPESIRQMAHSLSGSSSSLGARHLSNLAHELDLAANVGDKVALSRDLPRFVEAMEQTAAAVERQVLGLAPQALQDAPAA